MGDENGADVTATAQQPPAKKTRASKPKCKTGCVTCRIRRIKCDETKPNCKKCSGTGRKCDGYSKESVMGKWNWGNQLLDFRGTDMEHRYLSFFRRCTAPILSGCFDPHFWNGLVLQVGYSEPTIQHAMVAVACVHEQLEGGTLSSVEGGPQYGYFAIEQYNKAIACLKKRLSEGPQSREVILLCCVLFICLEFMRGNVDTAISHFQNGLNIINEWKDGDSSVPQNLCQIFSRLTLQSMLCGRLLPHPLPQVTETLNHTFTSLQDARALLDVLMTHSVKSLRDVMCIHPPEIQGQLIENVRVLHIELEKWSVAFDDFLKGRPKTITLQEADAITTLRILNTIAKIWLPSVLQDGESGFDSQNAAFSQVVGLASSLSTCQRSISASECIPSETKGIKSFTFEMGIIAPLYFVAIKCRIPSIRRAAVSLLGKTMPRREGIWIASMVGAIAQRIIDIEEEDLETVGIMDETWGELKPPERRRVYDAIIDTRAEDEVLYRKQKVTFIMFPDVGEPPKLLVEDISW